MLGNPLPTFVNPEKSPRFTRGDVILDDQFSRLYIVLETWWMETRDRRYKVFIVADWGGDEKLEKDHFGKVYEWGLGVEQDEWIGHVELPVNM